MTEGLMQSQTGGVPGAWEEVGVSREEMSLALDLLSWRYSGGHSTARNRKLRLPRMINFCDELQKELFCLVAGSY